MFSRWHDEGIIALPHWASHYDFISGINTHIRQTLKNNINTFLALRQEAAVDDHNTFLNEQLSEVFSSDDEAVNGVLDEQSEAGKFTSHDKLLVIMFSMSLLLWWFQTHVLRWEQTTNINIPFLLHCNVIYNWNIILSFLPKVTCSTT